MAGGGAEPGPGPEPPGLLPLFSVLCRGSVLSPGWGLGLEIYRGAVSSPLSLGSLHVPTRGGQFLEQVSTRNQTPTGQRPPHGPRKWGRAQGTSSSWGATLPASHSVCSSGPGVCVPRGWARPPAEHLDIREAEGCTCGHTAVPAQLGGRWACRAVGPGLDSSTGGSLSRLSFDHDGSHHLGSCPRFPAVQSVRLCGGLSILPWARL